MSLRARAVTLRVFLGGGITSVEARAWAVNCVSYCTRYHPVLHFLLALPFFLGVGRVEDAPGLEPSLEVGRSDVGPVGLQHASSRVEFGVMVKTYPFPSVEQGLELMWHALPFFGRDFRTIL